MKLDSAFLSFFSESFGQRALSRKHLCGSGASITSRALVITNVSILAEIFDMHYPN
jgi:hypothetical protein